MKNLKTDTEYQVPINKPTIIRVPSNFFIVVSCTAPEYQGGDFIINGDNITTKDQNGVKQVFSDGIRLHLVKSGILSDTQTRLELGIINKRVVDLIQYNGVETPIDYTECTFDYTGCDENNYITYKICEKEFKIK